MLKNKSLLKKNNLVEELDDQTSEAISGGRADLVIVAGRARDMYGQKFIEILVQNKGSSLATGVDGVCSYNCVGRGIRVSNQSFLQGGYLAPGRIVNGFLALTPCFDQSIFVDCSVDPNNIVQETNEVNNRASGTFSIN